MGNKGIAPLILILIIAAIIGMGASGYLIISKQKQSYPSMSAETQIGTPLEQPQPQPQQAPPEAAPVPASAKRIPTQETAPSATELQGIWAIQNVYYEFKGNKMCLGQLGSSGLLDPCPAYYPFTVDGDTIILKTAVPTVLKWAIKDHKLELLVQVTGEKLVLNKFEKPAVQPTTPKDYSIALTENQLKFQGVWKSSNGSYISFKFYSFTWQGLAGSGEYCLEVSISGSTTTCQGYTEFTMSGSLLTITGLETPIAVTLNNGGLLEITSEFKGSEKSVYNKTTLPLPRFKGVVEE